MSPAVGSRLRLSRPAGLAALAAILLLLRVAGAAAQSSSGTEFWLAFPSNLGTPDLTLFVSGETATNGTVEIPGLEFSQGFEVNPGQVTSIAIPADAMLTGKESLLDLGIHVTAGAPVSVYGLNRNEVTTDGYAGLPVDEIGTDYVVLGYSGDNSTLAIVGTQDDTTVTITPSSDFDSHPAGEPFQIGLNQGFAYQLTGTEVSGTTISADKPISVFGGATCAVVPADGTTCNHLVEQLPPTSEWGKSFLTEPLATRSGDVFRILASADNTTVTVSGDEVPHVLARGQFYETVLSSPAQITASQPVLVMQYSQSSSVDGVTGDPFELLVPPTDQFLSNYTVTAPDSFASYINLVVPAKDAGSVLLDGSAVAAGSFTPIGRSGFSGAALPVGAGTHTLSGPHGFGASVYGFADHDGYGYPAGFGTAAAPAAPGAPGGPAPKSDASVSVAGPAYARLGGNATFTDTIGNAGPNDATGVELRVPIPAGATFVSATLSNGNACELSGATIVCLVGTVHPSGAVTGTFVFSAAALGTLTQSASLQADYDTNGGNNSASAATQVIAADAPPPPPPPPSQPGTFNAIGTGTVTVNGQPLPPDTLTLILSGATVDVTNGTLTLTNFDGGTGTFSNEQFVAARRVASLRAPAAAASVPAMFSIQQAAARGAGVTLSLAGGNFAVCGRARSLAAKSQAPVRQLWGHAKGLFTTKGRYGAATIRGTTWLVQDRCDGTLTKAVDDVVSVADLVKKTTVTLQPGQSYLALAKPGQTFKPPAAKRYHGQTAAAVRKRGLVWGNELFVSKAQLTAWLERRGSSWQQFAARNPQLAAALAARG